MVSCSRRAAQADDRVAEARGGREEGSRPRAERYLATEEHCPIIKEGFPASKERYLVTEEG